MVTMDGIWAPISRVAGHVEYQAPRAELFLRSRRKGLGLRVRSRGKPWRKGAIRPIEEWFTPNGPGGGKEGLGGDNNSRHRVAGCRMYMIENKFVIRTSCDTGTCQDEGQKNREKIVDPGPDWVYIQECHPRGLIAQSGRVVSFCHFPASISSSFGSSY